MLVATSAAAPNAAIGLQETAAAERAAKLLVSQQAKSTVWSAHHKAKPSYKAARSVPARLAAERARRSAEHAIHEAEKTPAVQRRR
ncbi:hypothetical protein FOHLNKBM_5023 [Methylobacterium longum]|nr:hypothetical protein FOHLNKBM_5023 [Methylobacterium longum]